MYFLEMRDKRYKADEEIINKFKNPKKAGKVTRLIHDTEIEIDQFASTPEKVREIIETTQKRLRQLFKKGEEHDLNCAETILNHVLKDGMEWVKSKESD